MAPKSRFTARLVRRVAFASPVVAFASSCTPAQKLPENKPKEKTSTVIIANPPVLPAAKKKYDVYYRSSDRTCWEGGHYRDNPPPVPPTQVQCFEGVEKRSIAERKDGTCWVMYDVDCPPPESGMTCNPPPPQQLVCPGERALPTAAPSANVVRRTDGTCWVTPHFECPKVPEGQPRPTCNPPAPIQVKCETPKKEVIISNPPASAPTNR